MRRSNEEMNPTGAIGKRTQFSGTRMRTGIFVGFALCAAMVAGFVTGRSYQRRAPERFASSLQRPSAGWTAAGLPDTVLRAKDPDKWHRDSLVLAQWSTTRSGPPREISRTQTLRHCTVAFEIRDSLYRKYWLLSAAARSARSPGPVISRGWVYTTVGFGAGDTVSIVLPNVFCGDIVVSSIGGSLAPPRPLELDIR